MLRLVKSKLVDASHSFRGTSEPRCQWHWIELSFGHRHPVEAFLEQNWWCWGYCARCRFCFRGWMLSWTTPRSLNWFEFTRWDTVKSNIQIRDCTIPTKSQLMPCLIEFVIASTAFLITFGLLRPCYRSDFQIVCAAPLFERQEWDYVSSTEGQLLTHIDNALVVFRCRLNILIISSLFLR